MKLQICYFLPLLGISLAAITSNHHSGHGIFNGLESNTLSTKTHNSKQSDLDQTNEGKIVQQDGTVGVKIVPDDTKSQSKKDLKHSAVFLMPDSRGMQELLGVPDHNPYLGMYLRKRDTSEITTEHLARHDARKGYRHGDIPDVFRNGQGIRLEPGNIIPGSNGQSVLYGFPNGRFPCMDVQQENYPIANVNRGLPQQPYNRIINEYGYSQHFGGYKTHGY